ncbi:T6SS effector amidase Tae4 family protein [Helicobacter bilis]|nr:T6SS effector amidase Tae4 family protein [Helicobacter bilis]
MNTKAENQNFFYNELLTFNKNGLVAMEISGWNNAKGHITLWDNDKKRFLDDSNYLLDKRSNVIVRQFYFWEIE